MATIAEAQEFREKLLRAFPPQPFHGLVSTHTECDDGIALRHELPGKRWDEIPAEVVDFNSGSLSLLQPAARVAFLPAWLARSMEKLGPQYEGVLADFTMYFLCPGNEDEGWDEIGIARRVSLFDADQRSLVGDFLRSILENDALPYWHGCARHGLKWWCA